MGNITAIFLAAPGKPQGVYAEIQAERARQDEQWGGPSHDDEHSTWDWTRYISHQLSKLVNDDKPRQRLVNIAALAVSAAESMDRKSPGKPQGAQTSGTEGGE